MQGGAGLVLLAETIGATVRRATSAGGEAAILAEQLGAAVQRLLEVTAEAWGSGDFAPVLANATAYLEAVGPHGPGLALARAVARRGGQGG